MTKLVPVVLCGGSGTRFWPLSTDANPKQFLKLWQGKSLFQITIARLGGKGAAAPLIICNKIHEAETRRQLDEIGVTGATILLEPERRDSAAAIAVAAAWVGERHGKDAVIGIFASDQLITDEAAFHRALDLATVLAAEGRLVTFGITPDRPATEFGYVERAAAIEAHPGAFEVASFHEKPAADVAAEYLASGRFDWNSGMFVFTAAGFVAQAEIHMKPILDAARQATMRAHQIGGAWHLDAESFARAEKKSIDYALFELASGVAVVPVACGWSDVGNWRAAHVEMPKDAEGNVVIGDVRTKETRGSIVVTDGLPVRVLGVEGLAIVVSAEGVLVTRLEDAARLKEVV